MTTILNPRVLTGRHMVSAEQPGAIVIGGDYQGLGIVRSLGRRRIPICVIDDEYSIAKYSRYTSFAKRVRSLRHEDETIDALLSLGKEKGLDGWVLYPTRDETVSTLARHKTQLEQYFRVPTPNFETIRWVWDKRNTYQLANQLGIPTPRTWYPKTIQDLEEIDQTSGLVIKPAIKEHFFYSTRAKAWRADNREQLRELFSRAARQVGPGEVMIQDLIPGGGEHQYAYCAFFKDGEPLGSLAARRGRQHPPEFGRSSTFVETISLPALEESATRFLRAINYYGLVEVEFKYDTRDSQFKLLDVNGRTWGYHSVGRPAGVDFPHMLYRDQLGETVKACRGTAGIRWGRLITDLPMSIAETLGGRQNLRQYIRSISSLDVEAVFSSEDPIPSIAEFLLLPYLALKKGF